MGTIKGFRDFVGEDARKRAGVREIILKWFGLYGFEPAETPTIEFEEFVKGDNEKDEAVSEIFKLKDRGKRELALRYEYTFQLKRIARNQKLPYKRYQIGSVFRDEPVKVNRLREFVQCDADVVGSTLKDEAEMFSLMKNVFSELGIKPVIYVNNRKLLDEVLVSENIPEKYRDRALRELDKLDKLSKKEVADNLKKFGAEKLLKIFGTDSKKFEKYNYYKEIKELKKFCKNYGVSLEFQPTLVRGLSYYNGTIFEIKTKAMKETICAGGAYPVGDVQSFGISFGLDRISTLAKVSSEVAKVQIISIGEDNRAIALAENLRKERISVNLFLDKSIGKAMEYANSKGIEKVIFVGSEEIKKKKFKVKNMKTGKEDFLEESKIVESLR